MGLGDYGVSTGWLSANIGLDAAFSYEVRRYSNKKWSRNEGVKRVWKIGWPVIGEESNFIWDLMSMK